ncbi:MAG: PHP domain-containing protein [Clostridiaceae bacterium]|nr:PHP domain-containing protein [Clostridiaceae bacterium]
MDKTDEQLLLQQLNAPTCVQRLDALRQLKALLDAGRLAPSPVGRDVNNHIHTQYSFSPYSPAKAVWMAARAGLSTAGIMDHDSIGGAREFIEAGEIIGLPTTIGAECRASFAGTSLNGRRINNPDQPTVAYVALHGIPHSEIDAVADYFRPVQEARGRRNRLMTDRLNRLLQPADIRLDYDRDIVVLSLAGEGGEVTERHLLFAVAGKLLQRFGAGSQLVEFLTAVLKIPVREKAQAQLTDPANPHIAYDLLGVLKSDLVEKFYLEATEECPPIDELAAFAQAHGIILAYAYLGDVTASVTGDKKAQNFEDSYLDELFTVLHQVGFNAVTYMPSRNTREQLLRLRRLCEQNGFFQISGEDINQPRQSFICTAMRDPLFANLYDAAWALIGHERLASRDLEQGLFSRTTCREWPDLGGRIGHFRDAALTLYGIQ